MKELFEAEIYVDTVFSVESGAGGGNRFYLADYATMHEFETDCAAWFNSQSELISVRASAESEQGSTLPSACRKLPDEAPPEYVYTDWYGIPDCLITRTWLCPNIFEIRDALQMLDGYSIGRFPEWCRNNGHDLAKDDPLMLVTRYQDYTRPDYGYGHDPETMEPEDSPCIVIPYPYSGAGLGFGPVEIFGEDYN